MGTVPEITILHRFLEIFLGIFKTSLTDSAAPGKLGIRGSFTSGIDEKLSMVRVLTALSLGLICSINAQAALLAKYSFKDDLAADAGSVAPGVTAGAFTSLAPGSITQSAGRARFTATSSASFVNQATVQISEPASGIRINQIKFDLARLTTAGVGNGTLLITNNINGETFSVTSTGTSFSTQTWNLSPGFSSTSPIIFTLSQKWDGLGGPTFTQTNLRIDNFEINGAKVPEPASMAVFGVLGLAGIAYRRRLKANA